MRRELGIERQQIPDCGISFGTATEVTASRCHHQKRPKESGNVHAVRAGEGLLVLAFAKVIPERSEMHPTRVIGIEFHGPPNNRGAALELAGVHDLQSEDSNRVRVERVEGHRALGRRTKRRKVLPEKVCLRQRHHRELVRPIQLDPTPGRSQGSIKRSRVIAGEPKCIFVDVDLRETSP